MTLEQAYPKDFSPDVREWAQRKLAQDPGFIENRAKFGNPVIKSICQLILELGEKKKNGRATGSNQQQDSERQNLEGTHELLQLSK